MHNILAKNMNDSPNSNNSFAIYTKKSDITKSRFWRITKDGTEHFLFATLHLTSPILTIGTPEFNRIFLNTKLIFEFPDMTELAKKSNFKEDIKQIIRIKTPVELIPGLELFKEKLISEHKHIITLAISEIFNYCNKYYPNLISFEQLKKMDLICLHKLWFLVEFRQRPYITAFDNLLWQDAKQKSSIKDDVISSESFIDLITASYNMLIANPELSNDFYTQNISDISSFLNLSIREAKNPSIHYELKSINACISGKYSIITKQLPKHILRYFEYRNKLMLANWEKNMQNGSTLFCAGNDHCFDILEMLKASGYTIEAIMETHNYQLIQKLMLETQYEISKNIFIIALAFGVSVRFLPLTLSAIATFLTIASVFPSITYWYDKYSDYEKIKGLSAQSPTIELQNEWPERINSLYKDGKPTITRTMTTQYNLTRTPINFICLDKPAQLSNTNLVKSKPQ